MKFNRTYKIIFLIFLFFFYSFTFAQIGKKMKETVTSNSDIVGTWISQSGNKTLTLVLYEGNAGEFEGEEISYLQTDKKLTIKTASQNTSYNYFLKNNTLTLSGGDIKESFTFKRNFIDKNISTQTISSFDKNLLGTWESQGMQFIFKEGGILLFNNTIMAYTVKGNIIYCQNDAAGVNVAYQYHINNKYLMLTFNGNTLMLQKQIVNQNNSTSNYQSTNIDAPFLGSWISNDNEHVTFMKNGKMKLESYDLTYTFTSNTLTINSANGSIIFQYEMKGKNMLTVVANGKVTVYQRTGGNEYNNTYSYGTKLNKSEAGIDMTMVGKWCQMTTGSTSYSSNWNNYQCFVLDANGSYSYSSGSNRNVNAGSVSGQGEDRGTWSVNGNILIARSVTGGVKQYRFEKRNNKNGDPCIVVEGTVFVSYYNKPGW